MRDLDRVAQRHGAQQRRRLGWDGDGGVVVEASVIVVFPLRREFHAFVTDRRHGWHRRLLATDPLLLLLLELLLLLHPGFEDLVERRIALEDVLVCHGRRRWREAIAIHTSSLLWTVLEDGLWRRRVGDRDPTSERCWPRRSASGRGTLLVGRQRRIPLGHLDAQVLRSVACCLWWWAVERVRMCGCKH